ncbi:MAG: hypothetical protein M3018_02605, partial [Actinomycetota bacterium]|nr:hypothetical protein [Actinomycetota bacterium]
MPWKLTVRVGPRVERSDFAELSEALALLEFRARELARETLRGEVETKLRRFEPAQQVSARLELAGPERLLAVVRAGVDVRGDGSVQAYMGRVRRRVVQ